MKPDQIIHYCATNLPDTVIIDSWGEKGIFYNPGGTLKRGVYVLTIKEKDGAGDKSSNLDRENIYRLNIGIRKHTFQKLFGAVPARPKAGGIAEMPYDFSIVDALLPHPVYAWMGWISALNPTEKTFETLKPLIQEAYLFAKEKFEKRKRKK